MLPGYRGTPRQDFCRKSCRQSGETLHLLKIKTGNYGNSKKHVGQAAGKVGQPQLLRRTGRADHRTFLVRPPQDVEHGAAAAGDGVRDAEQSGGNIGVCPENGLPQRERSGSGEQGVPAGEPERGRGGGGGGGPGEGVRAERECAEVFPGTGGLCEIAGGGGRGGGAGGKRGGNRRRDGGRQQDGEGGAEGEIPERGADAGGVRLLPGGPGARGGAMPFEEDAEHGGSGGAGRDGGSGSGVRREGVAGRGAFLRVRDERGREAGIALGVSGNDELVKKG